MKDDFRDRSHLTVIDGEAPDDAKRKAWRRRALDQSEQVTCYACEVTDGVATSAVVEMTMAPRRSPDGKKTGGTKVYVCVYCLMKGRITKLIG